MKHEDIIKIAEKHGGTMIYVWGSTPRVDNLDLINFTKAIIEAMIEEYDEQVNDSVRLRDSGPDSSGGTDGRDVDDSLREGTSEVQLRQKGRKKADKKVKEGIQEGAASLREGS